MRRLRIALIVAGILIALALAGLWLLGKAFGRVHEGRARLEVQALYERAGNTRAEVRTCRVATEEDMDSPTLHSFVCTVATPSCEADHIFFVRRAVDPGWIDGDTLGPPDLPTVAREEFDVYRVCT